MGLTDFHILLYLSVLGRVSLVSCKSLKLIALTGGILGTDFLNCLYSDLNKGFHNNNITHFKRENYSLLILQTMPFSYLFLPNVPTTSARFPFLIAIARLVVFFFFSAIFLQYHQELHKRKITAHSSLHSSFEFFFLLIIEHYWSWLYIQWPQASLHCLYSFLLLDPTVGYLAALETLWCMEFNSLHNDSAAPLRASCWGLSISFPGWSPGWCFRPRWTSSYEASLPWNQNRTQEAFTTDFVIQFINSFFYWSFWACIYIYIFFFPHQAPCLGVSCILYLLFGDLCKIHLTINSYKNC